MVPMFYASRPTAREIERFLSESRDLPLSYGPIGLARASESPTEEMFRVRMNPVTREVSYVIRAVSRPRAALAKIGYPFVRLLQARFRHDSAAAVRRAVG
jgi:hypothetical protein